MNAALVDGIVKAVLYEGYMLYPYRPSAVKNRQRFNFGVIYPRAYSEAQGGTDAWTMQTECLVLGRCANSMRGSRPIFAHGGRVRLENFARLRTISRRFRGNIESSKSWKLTARLSSHGKKRSRK